MTDSKVTKQEVTDLLRQALRGEIPVSLLDPERTWEGVYAGDVGFRFGEWEVYFFNDCMRIDYTDRVKTPDGRSDSFDDWLEGANARDPLDLLEETEYAQLESLLEAVGRRLPASP